MEFSTGPSHSELRGLLNAPCGNFPVPACAMAPQGSPHQSPDLWGQAVVGEGGAEAGSCPYLEKPVMTVHMQLGSLCWAGPPGRTETRKGLPAPRQ